MLVEVHALDPYLAAWPLGRLAAWPLGRLAAWPLGRLAAWPLGRLAAWPLGRLAAWPLGRLAAAVTPLLILTVPAGAQTGDEETLEEVVITGSRIPRAGFDTLMPAIVIDGEFLQDRGFTDVATALNELPAFGLPGNSTQGDQGTFSTGQNFVNLYGLGSQRTLTLVNGRRFVPGNSPSLFVGANAGSQVDLNMIPTALVERIETISIGGAPIYGADAIAGTVNVIMKRDFEGFELRSNYGVSQENEMEETVFSLAWGANSADGRGNVSLAFEHSDRAGMIESDMPHLAAGWQFRENFDPVFRQVLVPRGTANIVSNNGVLTPGTRLVPNVGLGAWPDGRFLQFAPDGSIVPYDVGTRLDNAIWSAGGEGLFLPDVTSLFTPLRRNLATAFARYELAPNVEVFSEFWAARSEATELVNQPAYQSGVFGPPSNSLRFSATHPLLTRSARDTLAGLGATEFYLQRASADLQPDGNADFGKTDVLRGVLGLRGDFTAANRDFDWEISYNRGRSDAVSTSTGISSERLFYALDAVRAADGSIRCRVVADPSSRPVNPGDPFGSRTRNNVFDDCVPLDIFGQGRASQEALRYISVSENATSILDQEVWEATLSSTNLFDLPAGGFGFAAGVLRRTESGRFDVSGFTRQGLGRSVPISPVAGEYTSDEIYAEFYAPIVSQDMGIPALAYLNVEAAYRRIDNDFAGEDDVGTVGFKYAPIPDVELRGNVTRSVRAPAITELFLPVSGTSSFAADPCDATNIDSGPNPAARRANCAAGGGGLPGIAQPFNSSVRNASVQGRTGGNEQLKNETAEAYTFGVVLRPRFAQGLQWSIDYLDFDIKDSIETFTLTQVMNACYDAANFPNTFCNAFTRLPSGQLPTNEAFRTGNVNAGQRTFKAYVSEILYTFDALGGAWDIFGSIQKISESTRTLLGVTTNFKGEINNINAASEWQANLRVRYSRDRWSTFLQPRFIGKGIWDNDAAPNARSIPGEGNVYILNGGFRYDFSDRISAQININNLTDELPSPAVIAAGSDGIYDNIGRFYRLTLSLRL